MKKVITILSIVGMSISNIGFSQASTYSFTASSGTFTPITGATDVNSIEADDALSSAINIGFTFSFEGTNYTQFKVSSNGFMSFNTAGTANNSFNNPTGVSASSRPLLAPLWDDLDGSAPLSASKASYVVTGTAPNRVLTFEWLNYEWSYNSSSADISFQIKLYETTNTIEYVYRNDGGTLTSPDGTIGIIGTSTYLTLNNSGTSPIASSTTATTNIATRPATGQVYKFFIPTCPQPSSLMAGNVTTTTSQITWTHTTTALGYGYEYGVSGFTPGLGTPGTVSVDTVNLSGLLPNTTYDFYVVALCSVGDTSSVSMFSFTTNCLPVSVFPYTENFDGSLVSGVWGCWKVNNIDGGNTWSQANTYISPAHSGTYAAHGMGNNDDYLISPQFTIGTDSIRIRFWDKVESATKNNTYTIRVSTTGTAPADFTDSITTIDCTNTGWVEHIVNLPYTGQSIYVAFHQTHSASSFYGFGIDDFKAEVVPNCPEPTSLGSVNETSTSADVYWTEAGGATSWTFIYDTTGFNPDSTGTSVSATNDTMNISGLMNLTSYDFYVRAHCSGLDSSVLAGPFTFTTLCGAYTPNYSQDFTSMTYSSSPQCWEEAEGYLTATTSFISSTASDWGSDGFGNVGYTGSARLNIWSTTKRDWLISPTIDLGTTAYQVEFDLALTPYSGSASTVLGPDDTLAVVISTDNGATWSNANILKQWGASDVISNTGQREFLDLSSYSGLVKIGFYGSSTVSNKDNNAYIDNFFVTNLCVPTAVSMNDTACGTYTSPSGKIWTMAGTYMDTIPMVRGCDSVITVTLVVNNTTASVMTTVCDSYTAASGAIYTTTGMYMDTIPNAMGCDSIISINLTVNMSGSSATTVHACDSYTLPTGVVVTTSGVYVDTISTTLGCDSIVTTTLALGNTSYSTLSTTVCGSYTSPSGAVHTASGTFFDTIPNMSGCDSVITITVTIKATTTETRTVSACFSYTVPETGMTYNTSGTKTDVTTNAFGCTHTITTILTINTAAAGTVTISGTDLVCSATGVTYKWVDCDNDYSFILGATSQNFAPVRNGNYACWITTTNGCSDTTACMSYNSVSLEEYVISENEISIYPNPATDYVTIDILSQNEDVTIKMFDALGKLVYTKDVTSNNNKVTVDISNLERGIYTVSVYNEFFETSKKVTIVK